MSRLTRDRTAEPISRDQILRHEKEIGKTTFSPAQLTTNRIGILSDWYMVESLDNRCVLVCHLLDLGMRFASVVVGPNPLLYY